jgi:hypothetical protein
MPNSGKTKKMKKIWINSGVERTNSMKPAVGMATRRMRDMRRMARSRPIVAARQKPSSVASTVTSDAFARIGRISQT